MGGKNPDRGRASLTILMSWFLWYITQCQLNLLSIAVFQGHDCPSWKGMTRLTVPSYVYFYVGTHFMGPLYSVYPFMTNISEVLNSDVRASVLKINHRVHNHTLWSSQIPASTKNQYNWRARMNKFAFSLHLQPQKAIKIEHLTIHELLSPARRLREPSSAK